MVGHMEQSVLWQMNVSKPLRILRAFKMKPRLLRGDLDELVSWRPRRSEAIVSGIDMVGGVGQHYINVDIPRKLFKRVASPILP